MQLILFTGVQASGKSTFYQQYFYHTHLRINLDMLKTRHREKILFEAAIASKTKIVIDNTNMSKADRARYIQLAKTAGFEIISYYFETDLDSTLQRNAQREGKANITEKGVKATFYKLEVPNRSEGFDALFKVNMIENNGFSITVITE
ncbi:MAG: ATP-binding protein [Acinetobacter sp.]|nr:ATP-binding protein [Acinetobacter sp.]MDN5676949.1 ATP-binding protein [Acinetobacter sp.]